MLQIALLLVLATLAGALSGGLTARRMLRRSRQRKTPPFSAAPDSALNGDIEAAAASWASEQGRPEAAGIVADKLHLIHRVARRRGWWQ